MGLTKPYDLRTHGRVHLVECVNAARVPQARKQLLEGKFHRVYSEAKKRFITVEKKFFYSDFNRHQYFLVRLPSDRKKSEDANRELAQFMRDIPEFISPQEKRYAKVAWGLDDLREQLWAHEAKLDSAALKKIKTFLRQKHRKELQALNAPLFLERATKQQLHFRAARGKKQLSVSIPLKLAQQITGPKATVAKKLPPALETLKEISAELRKNERSTLSIPAGLLKKLPRGSALPAAARKDLEEIFNWSVRRKMDLLEVQLFEIRFDTKLEKDWAENRDEGDIGRLWKLLEELPESNVEGNTSLDEISLDVATGGGTFDSGTHDIAIGDEELSDPKRFPDVVRHEVGHAVHEMKEKLVNDWLKDVFGWEMFDPTDRNIDKWVSRMGGWNGITTKEKQQARRLIRSALGKGGAWGPPKHKVKLARQHPWHSSGFGPRLAVENSRANWFETNNAWYRSGGKAFFLNYWYGTLTVVGADTLDFINTKMPDQYAAMSPLEFFAELYALYFSHDQHKRRKLERKVVRWMAENIGRTGGRKGRGEKPVNPQSGQRGGRLHPKDGGRGGRATPQSGSRGGRLSPQDGSRGG